MRIQSSTAYREFLFVCVLLSGCTPNLPPVTPPENYKGPVAERPLLQQGYYWVYQRPNLTRTKTTALMANIGFPLWIGKTWNYEGQAIRVGQSENTMTPRLTTRVDCYATAFKPVTVAAGTFDAFECDCVCSHTAQLYEPGCGTWKFWYAPTVGNVLSTATGSTDTSMELVEFKAEVSAPSKPVPQNNPKP